MMRRALLALGLVAGLAASCIETFRAGEDAISTVDAGSTPDADAPSQDGASVRAAATVRGTVSYRGRPAAGVPVLIVGHASVVSDGNGRFSVPDVTPPYTVATRVGSPEGIWVYMGVRTVEPWLKTYDVGTEYKSRAAITLRGGAGINYVTPPSAGHAVSLAFAAPHEQSLNWNLNQPSPPFDFLLQWHTEANPQAKLHAIQYPIDGTGAATSFPFYGSVSLNGLPSDGGPLSVEIPVAPVLETSTMRVDIRPPPGFTVKASAGGVAVGTNVALVTASGTSTSFNLMIPRLGLPFFVESLIENSAGSWIREAQYDVPLQSTALTLNPKPPPTWVTPNNGAAGVSSTPAFVWTAEGGGPYMLQVGSPTSRNATVFVIYTDAPNPTWPNLEPLAAGLNRGTAYRATLLAPREFTDVDAIVGPVLTTPRLTEMNEFVSFQTAP